MTTPRLQRYLATLERRPFVTDLERVAAAIRFLGIPAEDWILSVHARFAGYVQPLGPHDEAVYGVFHERSKWLGREGIEGDSAPGDWSVSCADAHPSYDFNLYCDGSFRGIGGGGPSDSFEHKLEKDALWHDFTGGEPVRYVLSRTRHGKKEFVDEIVRRIQPEPDAAASDSHDTFYVVEDLLIHRVVEGGDFIAIHSGYLPSWIPAGDCFVTKDPFLWKRG
jgi:hypothetical protein